ncbi:MAG: trigger factor, partial [Muribaculaceae bacterium]|nr:trigger factor [Muribaculaceae bacterium]
SEIIVLRPAEHDQEFFDNVFGKDKVHNEEEYTAALSDMIANALKGNSEQLFAADAHKYFVEKFSNVQLPEEFLKKWLIARNPELTKENIDAEFTSMKNSLIWQLVKGDIATTLDVKVEEDDILSFAKSLAYQQFAQYGITNMDDDTITAHAKRILANDEYRQRIIDNVADAKIFNAVKEVITIDNKEVSLDEFKEIAEKA